MQILSLSHSAVFMFVRLRLIRALIGGFDFANAN